MFDTDKIEDLTSDLLNADARIRKVLTLPAEIDNPAELIGRLSSLASASARAAQAIATIMSHEHRLRLVSKDPQK